MQELETISQSQALKQQVVTVKQYAAKLNITVQAVYAKIKRGEVRAMKLGSVTLIYL